ncbi:MAG: nitroreductase family deazaflavin-dependent oxidoreductase [Chloroflexi bacterium]|nr:nitroreductase family deazaflavin-dependent oxidoreductase [Chloroflexota bacterium]
MDERTRQAIAHDKVIDITTTGRTSGEARRVEMWYHVLDGQVYITGLPGKRDWYANMVAHPSFTFHLKESAQADLPATARPITEPDERRAVLARLLEKLGRPASDLPAWEANSPLVAVTFNA